MRTMKLLLAFAVANPDVVTGLLLKADKKKHSSSSAGKDDKKDTKGGSHPKPQTCGSGTCAQGKFFNAEEMHEPTKASSKTSAFMQLGADKKACKDLPTGDAKCTGTGDCCQEKKNCARASGWEVTTCDSNTSQVADKFLSKATKAKQFENVCQELICLPTGSSNKKSAADLAVDGTCEKYANGSDKDLKKPDSGFSATHHCNSSDKHITSVGTEWPDAADITDGDSLVQWLSSCCEVVTPKQPTS